MDIDFRRLIALVVDDEPMMRALMKGLLQDIGVGRVLEAPDGAEALKYLDGAQNIDIDFVICDLEMPIIDGLEFVSMLRNSKTARNSKVPVVIVTGHSEQGNVKRAVDLGIHGFLVKPVSRTGLENQIIRALSHQAIDPSKMARKKQTVASVEVMDFNKKKG